MNEPDNGTTLVDGVPVVRATSIDDAPAIRLTDGWDAAYHEESRLLGVCVRDASPDGQHLFMELDEVVRAVPRAQLEDAMRKMKTDPPPTSADELAKTLRTTRGLLARYRRILESSAMLHVFQMSQIHSAPYRGETIDTDEVDAAVADADRIIGATE